MDDQELYIDSVQHNYGEKTVLSGVYLSCKPGEIVGLLGRNGSGKTTLLKIIFGSIKAKFKYQRIGDQFIKTGYLTRAIAYLPQQNFVPPRLTVAKAVDLFESNYKHELLKVEIIAENLQKRFNTLSGGQVRLIETLLILYSNAKYVLLDEPFSQLSPIMIEEMQMHIRRLQNEKGFIITDHYHEQIRTIATRIVLLHNGSNYKIDSASDLILHGYLPNI